jgi:hypothetical protein
MHTPINASVAGVVGLSNTRESRLNATGERPQASSINQAAKPLEENTNVGDRDAQEQYFRSNDERPKQQNDPEQTSELPPPMLQLPAEDGTSAILDMLG